MSFGPPFSLGNFAPENISIPDDPDELIITLKRILETHAKFINKKETAIYEETELQNNQTFPGATPQAKRQIYRKIINTGTLPNAGASAVAHGIAGVVNTWMFTRIYGFALDPTAVRWIPMPNSAPAYQVQLDVTAANVTITTVANLTNFTSSYVVLEFWKAP